MDGFFRSRIILCCALALAAASYGCGSPVGSSQKSAAPGYSGPAGSGSVEPDPPPAGGGGGTVVEAAGFFMGLSSTTANITVHRADAQYVDGTNTRNPVGTGNFTTKCKVAAGASAADRDILCIAEIEELDLYFSEMVMQYHVPANMCSYVSFLPYSFYAFEPGTGPTTTSSQVLADGTKIDVTNSLDGEPYCADYDHEKNGNGGKNCCVGDYTRTITTYAADGSVSNSVSTGTWEGNPADCLSGPGASAAWAYKSGEGYPLSSIDFVEGTGVNKSFAVNAALNSAYNGTVVTSNVWAANFYNPADHTGWAGGVPGGYDIRRPAGVLRPQTLLSGYLPSDSYVTTCYNRAEEVLARIRFMIRDWDENNIVEGNSPDSVPGGTDPDFPDQPLNDRFDWQDFGDLYPGSAL